MSGAERRSARGAREGQRDRPRAAAVEAAQLLRRRIVSGELPPGTLLAEGELIQMLELSRPTVREALRILASDGLVESRRGYMGGTTIRRPDVGVIVRHSSMLLEMDGATLADIWSALAAIEGGALRYMITAGVRGDQIERLLSALADEETNLAGEDFVARAGKFHSAIVEVAGNAALVLAQTMFSQVRLGAQSTMRPPSKRWRQRVHEEHAVLVQLLEAGKYDDALSHWSKHLDDAAEAVATRSREEVFRAFTSSQWPASPSLS